jgi:hypothetical protein
VVSVPIAVLKVDPINNKAMLVGIIFKIGF